MKIIKRLGKSVTDWLDRLAENNNETFQGRPLDCCSINRQNQPHGEKKVEIVTLHTK